MNFKDLIYNKNVVYVPIYSMFNHKTQKVNLACDGNINRWLTTFYKNSNIYSNFKIFCPNEIVVENYQQFIDMVHNSKLNIQLITTELIEKSAKIQRSQQFGNKILKLFQEIFQKTDLIIVEGQGLAKELINRYKDNPNSPSIAYWCPVCQTNSKTRSFFNKEDKLLNEELFLEANYVIVASIDQVKYLKQLDISEEKIIWQKEFIDRNLPIFNNYNVKNDIIRMIERNENKVVYLPFRLSDEGYKIWEIIEVVSRFPNIKIICPNINNSSSDEIVRLCISNSELSENQIRYFLNRVQQIDSSRDIYYSIIDNCKNVIIPYFEDINFIMHAAVDELITGEKKPLCKIVLNKNEFENVLKGK